MKKLFLLAAAAAGLFAASLNSEAVVVLTPKSGSSMVASNITYYGRVGYVDAPLDSFTANGGAATAYRMNSAGWYQIPCTNESTVTGWGTWDDTQRAWKNSTNAGVYGVTRALITLRGQFTQSGAGATSNISVGVYWGRIASDLSGTNMIPVFGGAYPSATSPLFTGTSVEEVPRNGFIGYYVNVADMGGATYIDLTQASMYISRIGGD